MSEFLKSKAIEEAQNYLMNKSKYVILDTETTGLKKNDVVVQIGIIDLDGNTLLDSLVRPTKRKRISATATNIHGISMKDLKDAPTLAELMPTIKSIIKDKIVLIYNAEYDDRLLNQSCRQDEIGTMWFSTQCIMRLYSNYVGEWNDYRGDYKWQKLPGGDHSAVGDCRATLAVLDRVAKTNNPNYAETWTPRKEDSDIDWYQVIMWIVVIAALLYFFFVR